MSKVSTQIKIQGEGRKDLGDGRRMSRKSQEDKHSKSKGFEKRGVHTKFKKNRIEGGGRATQFW